jgi:hypothetical protein
MHSGRREQMHRSFASLRVCDFFEFLTILSSYLFCLQHRFLGTSKKSQALRMTTLNLG